MSRTARLLVVPAAAATLLLAASPAWAHVHVEAERSGSGVTLSFHVPNEEAPAHTTSVVVAVPAGLGTLTPAATGAWKPAVAGDQVTWSGGAIGGRDAVDLRLQVGGLPAGADTLTFKVLQTYDNGETVAWIETAPPGAPEPEHPAPVLDVRTIGRHVADDDSDDSADDHAPAAAPSVSAVAPAALPAAAPAAPASDDTGTWIGGAGAVAGLAALGGLLAWRRRASAPTSATPEVTTTEK